MNSFLGAHLSTSGGYMTVFGRAQQVGARCIQIFVSSPRQWKVSPVAPGVAKQFQDQLKAGGFGPSFAHLKYLINLVSGNPETVEKSVTTVIQELTVAAELGLYGGMFHIGAHQDRERTAAKQTLIKRCQEIVSAIPNNVFLLLENSATTKKLGDRLEEIAELATAINHPQVGVCLDTAHAFAVGYELHTADGVEQFVNQVEKTLGWKMVKVLHLNDSKAALGSNRDLHENLGRGLIGAAGFEALVNHPLVMGTPMILEVPGYDKQGPDKPNVDFLKSLIH